MPGFDDIRLSLPDVWFANAKRHPHKPALACGDRVLSWRDFEAKTSAMANTLRSPGIRRGERVAVLSTALYTAGTWVLLMPTLFAGGTVHILAKFSPEELLAHIERESITHTFVVPGQIMALLDAGGFAGRDIKTMPFMLPKTTP